ncbi:hypothetical protein [Dyadobacter sandarakinus]|uniref:Uncharacterized protein n=1 Tax=Dyadobacter sandarakinus TaxID=2747268 RepID=A0ABX7IC85_9BACT|nr:hypothetical protein [Dyadobacter sandarakinus]QRR03554.1 hypothetical protein HWI92_22885 [Dyadobacter sandarakinus]
MSRTITPKADSHVSNIEIDPELERYQGIILFPEKLAIANEVIRTKKIPEEMQPKVPAEK